MAKRAFVREKAGNRDKLLLPLLCTNLNAKLCSFGGNACGKAIGFSPASPDASIPQQNAQLASVNNSTSVIPPWSASKAPMVLYGWLPSAAFPQTVAITAWANSGRFVIRRKSCKLERFNFTIILRVLLPTAKKGQQSEILLDSVPLLHCSFVAQINWAAIVPVKKV